VIVVPATVPVAGGLATTGTDEVGIARAIERWRDDLTDHRYTRSAFESWLRKECPRLRTPIAGFRLGWGPVTNAEYACFVTATGAPVPRSIAEQLPGDHPVWTIDSTDATAYCAWLSEMTGDTVRLPTEFEWEWAAGGPEHLEFPWGDEFCADRCNTIESGGFRTTPVGAFPSGAAPCGAVDMAGNVEELTSSWYRPYPGGTFVEDDLVHRHPSGYRVLRGGSCMLGGDAARTARRHGPVDGDRFRHQGFRIVVAG
jgi:formylglycine-generating enzyme required for sulfatase activity